VNRFTTWLEPAAGPHGLETHRQAPDHAPDDTSHGHHVHVVARAAPSPGHIEQALFPGCPSVAARWSPAAAGNGSRLGPPGIALTPNRWLSYN